MAGATLPYLTNGNVATKTAENTETEGIYMDADASHSGEKEAYNRRTTDYGNGRIEIAAYGVPRIRQQGSRITSSGKKAETTDEEQEERTKQQVYAIRRKIKGYALSNDFKWFITLTFNPKKVNSSDYETAKTTLSNWCRAMRDKNREEDKKFDYLIIPELHKSGAVHFHGLLSDISANFEEAINPNTGKPIIRHGRQVHNLTDWEYGFSDCEEIESPERAASYITKYVTSALLTDKKMYNKKRYFNSQGLAKPVVTYDMSDNTELDRFTPNFGIIGTDIDGRNIIDIGIYNLEKDKETGTLSQKDDSYFIAAKTGYLPTAEHREELPRQSEAVRQQKQAEWEKFLEEKRKSWIAVQPEHKTARSIEEDWEKMSLQAEANRQQGEEKMREYWEAEAKRKQQQATAD